MDVAQCVCRFVVLRDDERTRGRRRCVSTVALGYKSTAAWHSGVPWHGNTCWLLWFWCCCRRIGYRGFHMLAECCCAQRLCQHIRWVVDAADVLNVDDALPWLYGYMVRAPSNFIAICCNTKTFFQFMFFYFSYPYQLDSNDKPIIQSGLRNCLRPAL